MPSKNRSSAPTRKTPDAVTLLKADHQQVKEWFSQFAKTNSRAKKQQLANQICDALTVHTIIEEEIFYPAFLAGTKDRDTHHEALVEHADSGALGEQLQVRKKELQTQLQVA
jgi:hypothetical protein